MASLQDPQQQLMQSHEQVRLPSQELNNVKADMNSKLRFLDDERRKFETTLSMIGGGGGGGQERASSNMLVNSKTMSPKVFGGKEAQSYRTWTKKVRAYCNASKPGFKRFLKWCETQTAEIDIDPAQMAFDWKYKQAAAGDLYDFLVMHTEGEAQILVEQDEDNGPEAWRQLSMRFDPVGETYVIDQMSNLMSVKPCANMGELPAAISRWERAHTVYAEKTGGKTVPEDWKLPVLFKMVPKANLDEVRMRHRTARPEDKNYRMFSKVLIEIATQKNYDAARAKDPDAMDLGDVSPGTGYEPVEPGQDWQPEYTDQEWADNEEHLQEELNYLGQRKGNKGGGKGGKGGKGGCG